MNLITILLLNGGLTKTLGLGAFGVAILAIPQLLAKRFKSKVRKQRKKVNMLSVSSLVYLVIAIGLLILAPALILYFDVTSTHIYIFSFLWALMLGVLHCGLFYTYVDWAQKGIDILPDLFYTLAILIFGIVAFNAICLFSDNEGKAYFAYVMIPFIYTMLALKSYIAYKSIPDELYKGYKISKCADRGITTEQFGRSDDIENVNILFIVEGVCYERKTMFSAALLGVMIKFFLDEAEEHERVNLFNEQGDEHEYVFYFKHNFLESKKMIDPNLPVEENGIIEGDTIICHRIS